MKKIFTLISLVCFAMGVSAQEETYVGASAEGLSTEFKAVVDASNVATNVSNGNSVVKFGTTNVQVEAVGTGTPTDNAGAQDITIGEKIGDNEYAYTVNSTSPIKWEVANQGDISYYYVKGTGVPAVSAVAEEIFTDGSPTGRYRLKYTAFDPAVGGEPVTGLYYKFTVNVDGALKIGIWANKGNHSTYIVDSDTKQTSEYLVEGYINGQNYSSTDVEAGKATEDQVGKKKWMNNSEIRALGSTEKPWVIGAGNQPFWGNVIIDAKAGKTYWLIQGTTQVGFQGYTFAPGKTKEEMVSGIKGVKSLPVDNNNDNMYNLAGQRVDKNYKGVVIQNGKKFMNK